MKYSGIVVVEFCVSTWLGFVPSCLVKHLSRDFPGGPVVKTLCFHRRGCGFDPWSGN